MILLFYSFIGRIWGGWACQLYTGSATHSLVYFPAFGRNLWMDDCGSAGTGPSPSGAETEAEEERETWPIDLYSDDESFR